MPWIILMLPEDPSDFPIANLLHSTSSSTNCFVVIARQEYTELEKWYKRGIEVHLAVVKIVVCLG